MKGTVGILVGIVATYTFEYAAGAVYKFVKERKESSLKKERVIRPGKEEAEKAAYPAEAKFFHGQTVIKNKNCPIPVGTLEKDTDWYDDHRP